jgi:hypothetical protein
MWLSFFTSISVPPGARFGSDVEIWNVQFDIQERGAIQNIQPFPLKEILPA